MEEKLTFTNSKGDKISALLSNPTGSLEKPIIICCHGFTTHKGNFTNRSLKKIFNEKNISIFRFDFFGHGESEGDFADITVSEGVDDTLRAIDFLKEKGYKHIGLIGSSYGGATSITATAKSDDLFVLGLKRPVPKYNEMELDIMTEKEISDWKEKGYMNYVDGRGNNHKLNYTYYSDGVNHDGYKDAENISIPTIIVHGDKDEYIKPEYVEKLSKILKNCELHVMKGAGHKFSNDGEFDEMIRLISSFVIKECENLESK